MVNYFIKSQKLPFYLAKNEKAVESLKKLKQSREGINKHYLLNFIHNNKGVFCCCVDRQPNRWSKAMPPPMVKLSGRVKAAPGKCL